jgi:hypothetical protein
MKMLLISVALIFCASLLFVMGHSKGIISTLFLASWVCVLIFVQEKKLPNLRKRFYSSGISFGYALVLFLSAKFLNANSAIDFFLVGIFFTAVGWFFDDISKII